MAFSREKGSRGQGDKQMEQIQEKVQREYRHRLTREKIKIASSTMRKEINKRRSIQSKGKNKEGQRGWLISGFELPNGDGIM